MKIINNTTPLQIKCERCRTLLEYEKGDVETGEFGCAFVTCPVCFNKVFLLDGKFDKVITTTNISYPRDFTTPSLFPSRITDKEINDMISQCIEMCDNSSKETPFFMNQIGGVFVLVCKFDDEYCIIVSDKYRESSIPR